MDGSLIEAARQKAREIAAAYSPGTQFQLLTNNASGIQFRWMSHEEFLDAVNEVEAGAVTTTLSSIARRQNEFLHTSTAGNRHAYTFSAPPPIWPVIHPTAPCSPLSSLWAALTLPIFT